MYDRVRGVVVALACSFRRIGSGAPAKRPCLSLPRFPPTNLPGPNTLAQEIIAAQAGHPSWAALKASVADPPARTRAPAPELELKAALPVLYVRDVAAAAAFWRDKLGFKIDFLHGNPAFYGAVSRDGACLHLKFVHAAVFGPGRIQDEGLIMAYVPTRNLKALIAEFQARQVPFSQPPTKQAWGGTDVHVLDPDGNRIAFVE